MKVPGKPLTFVVAVSIGFSTEMFGKAANTFDQNLRRAANDF